MILSHSSLSLTGWNCSFIALSPFWILSLEECPQRLPFPHDAGAERSIRFPKSIDDEACRAEHRLPERPRSVC